MSLRNDFLKGVSTTAMSHALLSPPKQAGAIQQSNNGALKLLENKVNSDVFYREQIDYIKTFFADENFQVADALFDYLLALKAGKTRKKRLYARTRTLKSINSCPSSHRSSAAA
jgi:hypothetical protein